MERYDRMWANWEKKQMHIYGKLIQMPYSFTTLLALVLRLVLRIFSSIISEFQRIDDSLSVWAFFDGFFLKTWDFSNTFEVDNVELLSLILEFAFLLTVGLRWNLKTSHCEYFSKERLE